MATFTQEGATMSDDEILNAFMEEAFPEDDDESNPKGQAESDSEQEGEELTPTDDLEDEQQEESEDTGEDKEEKWIPSSIQELAEALEVEPDALKAIKIHTKVDGVEADVPLGEVIKNYQLNKAVTERSEQVAHARKQLEAVAQQFAQQRNEQLAQWQAWNQVLETRLKEQVGAIDWNQLREDDPAEYAAKRQEFTERIGEIESMKAQMVQQQRMAQAQALQQQHMAYQQALNQNIQKLPELIPEYKDSSKMKTEMEELRGYLNGMFAPEEVDSVYDARHIAIARKAMLYDKMMANGKPKVEKIKEKPKFVRPTSRTSQGAADRKRIDNQYKRAVQTQSTDDWAKIIEDRLFS